MPVWNQPIQIKAGSLGNGSTRFQEASTGREIYFAMDRSLAELGRAGHGYLLRGSRRFLLLRAESSGARGAVEGSRNAGRGGRTVLQGKRPMRRRASAPHG